MNVVAGSRLGPYEIVAPLGAGGMGEVYRARDLKLKREVAIKILPAAFAQDPDRVARFQREAEVLAALNHPHIAHIHGFEQADGISAIVMELVEGQTLAERVAAQTLPVTEAIDIARQIANALEAAHEKGIVHRDLKPANVKISPDDRVKVLDFGLAAVVVGPGQERADISKSPTLTVHATQAGLILGTAAYMSPEQARGRTVDKRADIWAFGVVLFEMVTGRQPFTGSDLSEVLASVIKEQPQCDDVPPQLRRLIKKCLEKDPAKRLRDIGDVWELVETEPSGGADRPPARSRAAVAGWVVAAVLAVATASVVWLALRQPAVTMPPATVVDLDLPLNGALIQLSPDGHMISFGAGNNLGQSGGKNSLWIRSLDSGEVRMLPGTEGYTANMFWSPDSRFVCFIQDEKLRKVAVAGGPPSTMIESVRSAGRGGTWNREGTILLGSGIGILRASSSGGPLTPLTELDPAGKDYDHISPEFLPDGKHFLYVRTAFDRRSAAIFVGSIDNTPKEQPSTSVIASTQFGTADAHVYFVSTDDSEPDRGYVVFKRESTVLAQSFDAKRLVVTGDPIPVSGADARFFTASRSVLAYNTGATSTSQLTWFNRSGKIVGRVGDPMLQAELSLSPDASKVATAATRTSRIVLALDTVQNTTTRITSDSLGASTPVWSPDGTQMAFAVRGEGRLDLYRVASNGAGQPQLLLKSIAFPQSWWGNTLLFATAPGQGVSDLWTLALDQDGAKPVPYLQSPASERQGQFSPDGKWVAYTSDESGTFEVYVSAYPDPAKSKTTISSGGGNMPRWSHDGKELFYFSPDDTLIAVPVTTGGQLLAGTRSPLFKAAVVRSIPWGAGWDITRDGRFLINLRLDQAKAPPATLVLNWQSRLSGAAAK